MEQNMLNKANTNKGWLITFYKNCAYRTFCFISTNKDYKLKDKIINIMTKYDIYDYKIIYVNNNDVFSITICLEEYKYIDFIDRLNNHSYSCYYNCFPIF